LDFFRREQEKASLALAAGAGEEDGGGAHPIQFLAGHDAFYEGLRSKLDEGYRTLALRDDYDFWKAHSEDSEAGKPLLLPPADSAEDHHILFDDNILREQSHIADPREAVSGDPIAFDRVVKRHIVRVDPVAAVMDPQYYVKEIGRCEASLHAAAAEARVAGLGSGLP